MSKSLKSKRQAIERYSSAFKGVPINKFTLSLLVAVPEFINEVEVLMNNEELTSRNLLPILYKVHSICLQTQDDEQVTVREIERLIKKIEKEIQD